MSHDLCSTQGRQENSITFDDVLHRDIEALNDNVSSRSHSQMVEASDYSACANVASKR